MWNRPLIWYIFPIYLFVIIATLVAITTYTTRAIDIFFQDRISEDLEARGRIMREHILTGLLQQDHQAIDQYCKSLGKDIRTRITVMMPDGRIIGDTEEAIEKMDNHKKRPEMQLALKGHTGHSVRFSKTLAKNMIYVSCPIKQDKQLLGVVRVSVPLTMIDEALLSFYTKVFWGGVMVAFFAVFFSLFVTRRMSRPLEEMKQGAERFAQGDFRKELNVPRSQEMGSLAQAMNLMARQLDDRIRTVINQRNQQEAVLSSMVEGVLAIDNEERIISINDAAARLMDITAEDALHMALHDVVKIEPLHEFISFVLHHARPSEKEFVISKTYQQILQAHGAVLRDARGKNIGALVVFNDVTRLRRLEQVRRDFVANVSHELRTPITSIKGFVETMLDGALEDPEDARHFLGIVAKQADRLNAILGDLLTLARIEQGEEAVAIQLEEGPLEEVLRAAVMLCESKAEAKEIAIHLECASGLDARLNMPLLEQAVTNLVDNAIKYSDHAAEIRVSAYEEDNEIVIKVEDEGVGIPKEHLPRLFERFYRVDKARSRSLGGTGLGLSIVKHIAKAHDGRVTVESEPGVGTTFCIRLPRHLAGFEDPF